MSGLQLWLVSHWYPTVLHQAVSSSAGCAGFVVVAPMSNPQSGRGLGHTGGFEDFPCARRWAMSLTSDFIVSATLVHGWERNERSMEQVSSLRALIGVRVRSR